MTAPGRLLGHMLLRLLHAVACRTGRGLAPLPSEHGSVRRPEDFHHSALVTIPWQRRLRSTHSAQAARGFRPLMGLWTDAVRLPTGPTALLLRSVHTQTRWRSWLQPGLERSDLSAVTVRIYCRNIRRLHDLGVYATPVDSYRPVVGSIATPGPVDPAAQAASVGSTCRSCTSDERPDCRLALPGPPRTQPNSADLSWRSVLMIATEHAKAIMDAPPGTRAEGVGDVRPAQWMQNAPSAESAAGPERQAVTVVGTISAPAGLRDAGRVTWRRGATVGFADPRAPPPSAVPSLPRSG